MLQCIRNFCVCSRIHMCVHEHTKFSNTLQHIYFKSFIYMVIIHSGGNTHIRSLRTTSAFDISYAPNLH